jgi:UDP-N-acetyl-D-glucosamine dehydrogenase
VGLPLAVEFAKAGFEVTGIDLTDSKVARVNAGDSYVGDIPSATLAPLVKSGKLKATTDFSVVRDLDTVNICVPTPLRKTKDPDISYIVASVEQIAKYKHPGMLVVLESTTYPGTTEEVIQPMLEDENFRIGKEFHLAFSPERVDPGNPRFNTKNIPKVVGGVTPACTEIAVALYSSSLTTVVPVSNARVAETVKLLENTFRSVNIGLVNEIALMCNKMNIDVWEVIRAASTKPFGFMPFYPGPGLGGHCIPIDPFYLTWKAREYELSTRFIELAGEINTAMPRYVVARIADELDARAGKGLNGARILILGLAYKKNVDDTRESPAFKLIELLEKRGAACDVHDPYVPVVPRSREHPDMAGRKSVPLDPAAVARYDAVLIVTDHDSIDYMSLANSARLIVDTRNACARAGAVGEHIVKA